MKTLRQDRHSTEMPMPFNYLVTASHPRPLAPEHMSMVSPYASYQYTLQAMAPKTIRYKKVIGGMNIGKKRTP